MRHATKPLWGVQFHPESIATEHGRTVLRNFRDITLRRMHGGNSGCCPTVSPPSLQALSPSSPPSSSPSTSTKTATTPREVHVEAWSGSTPTTTAAAPRSAVSAHSIFTRLFSARRFAFWLDSSSAQSGNSRFSYMGCADGPLAGPLSKVVEYCASTRRVQVRHRGGAAENGERMSEEDDDDKDEPKQPRPAYWVELVDDIIAHFSFQVRNVSVELYHLPGELNKDHKHAHVGMKFMLTGLTIDVTLNAQDVNGVPVNPLNNDVPSVTLVIAKLL